MGRDCSTLTNAPPARNGMLRSLKGFMTRTSLKTATSTATAASLLVQGGFQLLRDAVGKPQHSSP